MHAATTAKLFNIPNRRPEKARDLKKGFGKEKNRSA
jgi:hypothetical protein